MLFDDDNIKPSNIPLQSFGIGRGHVPLKGHFPRYTKLSCNKTPISLGLDKDDWRKVVPTCAQLDKREKRIW